MLKSDENNCERTILYWSVMHKLRYQARGTMQHLFVLCLREIARRNKSNLVKRRNSQEIQRSVRLRRISYRKEQAE